MCTRAGKGRVATHIKKREIGGEIQVWEKISWSKKGAVAGSQAIGEEIVQRMEINFQIVIQIWMMRAAQMQMTQLACLFQESFKMEQAKLSFNPLTTQENLNSSKRH